MCSRTTVRKIKKNDHGICERNKSRYESMKSHATKIVTWTMKVDIEMEYFSQENVLIKEDRKHVSDM